MVPIAVFTLALFRPCMPPILTSMLYLQYSWADSGQSGIMFKTATAILMSYFWFMIPGTVLTEVLLFLLYPAEVKLMILKEIKRNMSQGGQATFEYLTTFRTLQLLSDMHNSVCRQPAMPALIWSVIVCESFALYILITSAYIIPFPVLILFAVIAVELFVVIVAPLKMVAKPTVKSVDQNDAKQLGESMQNAPIVKNNWKK
ncbi:hypothetical protein Fcan01_01135 [Folsomia candida]|uniref:Uncharacterized protein n=1 Tax=Folsomia candida TaxID=158441 RepID=A0A226F6Q7_FOLCA|nr:hypothetical protein Fcan01_01135 [Folsomia candida]